MQTSLRTFALSANILKDVCTILQFVQTSLRTFAHFHCKNKGFWAVFGGSHSNCIHECAQCAHTVHFPTDVCFSTTFSEKCANVLKDVCTNLQFVQTSLRTFAQFMLRLFIAFLQISGLLKKGLNLLVGFSWRLGLSRLFKKATIFLLLAKILICY